MKKYEVIYADPPWSYKSKRSGKTGISGAAAHYKTMELGDIKAMPIKDLSEKNAVLFLWAVNPMLPDAIDLMKEWGFAYKTTITWRKIMSMGMGYWWRGQCEFLLFGTRGKVKAFRMQEANILQLKVGKHSSKPHEFRQLIERATLHMPNKLELFARSKWPNWDVFGNQVENSITI
jgi:N6-adenosine-specific RNA methylase IME4